MPEKFDINAKSEAEIAKAGELIAEAYALQLKAAQLREASARLRATSQLRREFNAAAA